MAEPNATDAAVRKAQELNVDLDQVEGTGAEGSIKASDVEAFAAANSGDAGEEQPPEQQPEEQPAEAPEEAPEEDGIVKVYVPRGDFAYGPDGVLYRDGDGVRESYFDAVLAGEEDRDGRAMFEKGGEA